MSYDWSQTALGVNFLEGASMLCNQKISAKQEAFHCRKSKLVETMNHYFQNGYRFVSLIDDPMDTDLCILILEN